MTKKISSLILALVMMTVLSLSVFASETHERTVVSERIISIQETTTTIEKVFEVVYSDGTSETSTLKTYYPAGRPGVARANSGTAYADKSVDVRSNGNLLGTFTFYATFTYGPNKVSCISKSAKSTVTNPYYNDITYSGGTSGTKSVTVRGKDEISCPSKPSFRDFSVQASISCDTYGNTWN